MNETIYTCDICSGTIFREFTTIESRTIYDLLFKLYRMLYNLQARLRFTEHVRGKNGIPRGKLLICPECMSLLVEKVLHGNVIQELQDAHQQQSAVQTPYRADRPTTDEWLEIHERAAVATGATMRRGPNLATEDIPPAPVAGRIRFYDPDGDAPER